MANYTIQKHSSLNNAIEVPITLSEDQRTVYIKPNPGYVVAASYFSGPSDFTDRDPVTSMTFTDEGDAGQPGNVVKLVFGCNTITNAADINLNLSFTGDAKFYEDLGGVESKDYIDFHFKISDDVITNTNINFYEIDQTSLRSNTFNRDNVSFDVKPKKRTLVGYVKISSTTGNYIPSSPVLNINNGDANGDGKVEFDFHKKVSDKNGYDIEYWYEVYYYSSKDKYIGDNIQTSIVSPVGISIPAEVVELTSIDYGSNIIKPDGENKNIFIYGSIGAKFGFEVVRSSDTFTLFNQGVRIISDNSTTKGFSSKIETEASAGAGWIKRDFIPLSFNSTSTNESYSINITPLDNTTINSSLPSTNPRITLNQYLNPIITLGMTHNSSDWGPKYVNGLPGGTAESMEHISSFEDLNFTHTVTVPNLTFTNAPYHDIFTFIGEVKENETNTIYVDTSILPSVFLDVGNAHGIVEDGITTASSSDIGPYTSHTNEKIVYTNANFSVGTNKSFTVYKSIFPRNSIVSSISGYDLKISNLSVQQVGADSVYSYDINIDKFGLNSIILTGQADIT